MRRTFTFLIALAFAMAGTVYAQCTPNPNITDPGIFPTPIDGVAPGMVGSPYSQVLTVNVPQDTTIDLSAFFPFPGLPTITVTVNFLTIDNFGGLPPGLGYTTNPGSASIIGGSSGCIDISGTPTTAGQYVSNLETSLNVAVPASVPIIGGTNQDIPGPLAYNFDISGTSSVNPAAGKSFTVGRSHPNPASDYSKIDFQTTSQSEIVLEVYSITGQQMHTETASYASGDHSIDLDLRSLESGVYFYTLSNGSEKVTRRLVVGK